MQPSIHWSSSVSLFVIEMMATAILWSALCRFHSLYHCSHSLSLIAISCHSLSLVVIRCHSLSFVVTRCNTRCHSLYHSLSNVVIRSHSLSLVVPQLPLICVFIKYRIVMQCCYVTIIFLSTFYLSTALKFIMLNFWWINFTIREKPDSLTSNNLFIGHSR